MIDPLQSLHGKRTRITGLLVILLMAMLAEYMPGQINLSEKTYELVKEEFSFVYRGEIEAKNKGALKMYFVEKQSAFMLLSK